jgi:hypothetical protein
MKKVFIPILAIAILVIGFTTTTSCTKNCDPTVVRDSTIITQFDTVTNTQWVLQYVEGSAGNNTFYAPQSFIKNGKATFASNLYHASQWFSIYDLPLPKEINLNLDTDSLKLIASIRNINGDGTANEMDLGLIYNLSTQAQAQASWQKGSNAAFCLLGITGQTINNVTEQLTNTSTYEQYAISVQGNNVTSYKNTTTLKSTPYTGTIGSLNAVRVAFRGYGEIDFVKLYKGNKLIMIEDFNVDGTTSALWSKP